jgi:hypothetical protein
MPQLFSPASDTVARTVLVAALVVPFLLVALAYGVAQSPMVTDQKAVLTQPVPFSHEHHVGQLGIDCRYCHTEVEKAWFAGMPPTETCMTCHSQIWTNAAMLAPVRESFATDKPIPWQRVYRIPDYVYFDHSVHVAKGVGCTTCHGPVNRMPLMYQEPPLTMGWCLDCHRDPTKNLRPQSQIFSLDWQPPSDQEERGHKLLAEYGIKVDHLTDCSVCHR